MPSPLRAVVLDGSALTPAEIHATAALGAPVRLAPKARQRMAASRRALLAAVKDGQPHYGVNTGFGALARQRIAPDDLTQLQRNLVRSHAAGAGAALSEAIVRGTMLCLAASLARARSGVR